MSDYPTQADITIRVKLDTRTFRRFAFFDTFKRQKRLRQPLFFALILLAFAIVCFSLTGKGQNVLIGSVLTALAISLPCTYLWMYRSSVNKNAKLQKLPRDVYELAFSGAENGIFIRSLDKKREQANYEWAKVYALYREKSDIYLYMTAAKAFILPAGQASASDEALWQYLKEHVSPDTKLT